MYPHPRFSRHLLLAGFAITTTLSPLSLNSVAQAAPTTSTTAPVTTTTVSPTTSTTTTTTPGAGVTIVPLPINPGVLGGSAAAISCTAPGYCVTGGVEILKTAKGRGVLTVETNGTWGKAQEVGAALRGGVSTIVHVVCPRAGSCVALGQMLSTTSPNSSERFSSYFVVQHGSRWAPAQLIPTTGLGAHPSYLLTGMACVAAGSCVLTGTLLVNPSLRRVFALTWRNGHWSAPHFLSSSALGASTNLMSLSALSCVGSWCEGVGLYTNVSKKMQPYVVTYSGGRWHSMHALVAYRPTTNVNLLATISCTGVGSCVAGGESDPMKAGGSTALVVEENHGRWSAPYALDLTGANILESISCTTPTSCTGLISHTAGTLAGVATMSAIHHWSVAPTASVPGWNSLQGWALSCTSGQCTIAGTGTKKAAGPPLPIVITPGAG
jgi:hypothetical protein